MVEIDRRPDRRRALVDDRRPVHGRVARPDARRRADRQGGRRSLFRGGAYKPRTSPYAFQGLGEEGLRLWPRPQEETGLPIVTEVHGRRDLEALVEEYADVLQIGARNMQNYPLLRRSAAPAAGAAQARHVGDDRGAADVGRVRDREGNPNVILCERGIRTFETATATRSTSTPSRCSRSSRTCP